MSITRFAIFVMQFQFVVLASLGSGWAQALPESVKRANGIQDGARVYVPSAHVAGVAHPLPDHSSVVVITDQREKLVVDSSKIAKGLDHWEAWRIGQSALLPNGKSAKILNFYESGVVELKTDSVKARSLFFLADQLKHPKAQH